MHSVSYTLYLKEHCLNKYPDHHTTDYEPDQPTEQQTYERSEASRKSLPCFLARDQLKRNGKQEGKYDDQIEIDLFKACQNRIQNRRSEDEWNTREHRQNDPRQPDDHDYQYYDKQ
jgi:hypothetical protein